MIFYVEQSFKCRQLLKKLKIVYVDGRRGTYKCTVEKKDVQKLIEIFLEQGFNASVNVTGV